MKKKARRPANRPTALAAIDRRIDLLGQKVERLKDRRTAKVDGLLRKVADLTERLDAFADMKLGIRTNALEKGALRRANRISTCERRLTIQGETIDAIETWTDHDEDAFRDRCLAAAAAKPEKPSIDQEEVEIPNLWKGAKIDYGNTLPSLDERYFWFAGGALLGVTIASFVALLVFGVSW